MKPTIVIVAILAMIIVSWLACEQKLSCQEEMISILKRTYKESNVLANQFYPQAAIPYYDSLLKLEHSTPSQQRYCKYLKAKFLLELGEENQAIQLLKSLQRRTKIMPTNRSGKTWRLLICGKANDPIAFPTMQQNLAFCRSKV